MGEAKRSVPVYVALLVVFAVCSSPAAGGTLITGGDSGLGGWDATHGDMGGTTVAYYVCLIRDHLGEITIEAIPEPEVRKREAAVQTAYAEAYKLWRESRKQALANKEEFTDPKPKAPEFRRLQKTRGSDARAKADTLVAVYTQKLEAKRLAADEAKAKTEAKAEQEAKARERLKEQARAKPEEAVAPAHEGDKKAPPEDEGKAPDKVKQELPDQDKAGAEAMAKEVEEDEEPPAKK